LAFVFYGRSVAWLF